MSDIRNSQPLTMQLLGLLLLSAVMLTMLGLSFLVFGGEDAAPSVVIGLAVFAATYMVGRTEVGWRHLFGLIATVLSLGVFFLAFGVFQIFSPVEFIVGLLYVLGFLIALIGGFKAFGAARRGVEPPSARRLGRVVLALVGVAAVVSVVGFATTRETVSEGEASEAVALDMIDFEFEPESAKVPAGGKLLVHNSDMFAHDFTLEALGIAVPVGPGSDVVVDLSQAGSGTYEYFCSLHYDGTSGMEGTLTVG